MPQKVIIVGAGLVGTLNACYFAKRGWNVEVYEYRPDIRKMDHVQGRSINLALSHRGKSALKKVALDGFISDQGIPMYARLVHSPDGVTTNRQPYGTPQQHIVSISRRQLNEVMISQADRYHHVKFFFGHKLRDSRLSDSELVFERQSDGATVVASGDLLVGCDGAHSALRRSLLAYPLFDFQQRYIEHGYIELHIPPATNGDSEKFALEPNVFHLWPRGAFVLIALGNTDRTFTVTLFAPFALFSTLTDDDAVEAFFQQHFPDALRVMDREQLLSTFREVSPSSLVSVKCRPHHFNDNVVLLGDAAHAMVPFYGQGMNCGFEDVLVLSEMLDKHNDNIAAALADYSKHRCDDAEAICDLAMYNYLELRDLVNSRWFRLRKKVDYFLHWLLPQRWVPLYTMVTFSRIPYADAVRHRSMQDGIINFTTRALLVGGVLFALTVFGRRTVTLSRPIKLFNN